MKTTRQLGFFDELVIDNFAGGGGASLGIEIALGQSVDVAINHNPKAVAMHKVNHPLTKHYCEDVFEVDPLEVTGGRPVKLAWFSPDCTHFSNAKGGQPVSKKIRGLAWVVIRWAKLIKPRVIMLENVPEFMTWGPLLSNGKPCPDRKGQTFKKFVSVLERQGYVVEFRKLRACDYGAPTSRLRLFMIARCDGQPIVWPEPTHGKGKGLKPYRTAADIIDWSIPMGSIFERKRPLKPNSLRRIALGIKKYVIDSSKPFLTVLNHSGDQFRGQDLDTPFPTVTKARDAHTLVSPVLIQSGYGERKGQAPRFLDITQPIGTIVACGVKHALSAAFMLKQYGGYCNPMHASVSMDEPVSTVTAKDHNAVIAVNLNREFGNSRGADVQKPVPTVMPEGGGKCGLVASFLIQYNGASIGQDVRDPLNTVPSKERFALVTIKRVQYVIADILYRMLVPRELFRAQGFPDTYIIDRDDKGNPIVKTDQVAMCGNSVCPPVAAALVKANFATAQLRRTGT